MTKKQKKELRRIIIALCMFAVLMITNIVLSKAFSDRFPDGLASIIPGNYGWLLTFGLYFAVYLFIGYDVLAEAFMNILHGQMLDENFLMCIATVGAFGLGIYNGVTGQEIEGFDEGCAVLLFYQIGEWFEGYAVGRSRKSITSLMDIRPDFANVLRDGKFVTVSPEEVSVDEIIQVRPGEKIPLDGVIISGSSTLDTKALTGESLPQEVITGENVISGTVNITSTLEIRVQKAFYDSTVSKILDLVENASAQKSRSETFITKFARVYTPIVVGCAAAVAFLPPLIYGFLGDWSQWSDWIHRALCFLVVSCPCALVISVPLSFFAGIGGASGNGILIQGSVYLERFNDASIFVFDKTGTLTKGNFAVSKIYPEEKKEEILEIASIAENQSNHPIAISIKKTYGKEIPEGYTLEDVAGMGIKATGEHVILCGNSKLMDANGIDYTPVDDIGTMVYVAEDGKYVGCIVIADEIKPEAKETIAYLNSIGAKTIMLTGDNEKIASYVAKQLGVTEYKAGLLPQNKVEEVDALLRKKNKKDILCFVGDGINDAPVIMRSDVGISMGGVGSDAAIEASDIVLMHDNLRSIGVAKKLAKKTMTIVYENIYFAIGVKVIILILSALNITGMWLAVFGDVGVAVIAILNAMRANTKIKQK